MSVLWLKYLSSFFVSQKKKIEPLVDPKMQTRELPDGSRICNYLKTDELKSHRYEDARTLYDAVRRGANASNNGSMLGQRIEQSDGTKPYVWVSYNEIIDRSLSVARALRKINMEIGQNTFIGVYSRNRPEWIIIEQATYAFSNILVPLYDTLGPDASAFVINQASIEVIFCDTVKKVSDLLDKKAECASLKFIVLIEPPFTNELKEKAEQCNVRLFEFSKFEELGKSSDHLDLLQPPKPEDLCTICYTSGTTGTPKGVMLTHGNMIADCTTLDYFKHSNINHQDVMISFLPLAHMFERVVQAAIYMEGGAVGFFSGDLRMLADDIKQLRPTVMPVVPRVLNRLHDKVMAEVNNSVIRRFVLSAAIAIKSRELGNWAIRNDSLVDKYVFKKIREGLGGRVKLMITGSAPISSKVLTFIRCAVGCFVIEGYGQTECVAACSVTIEGDFVSGHVGVPSPCNAIKLVDVPELNYFAKDQAGEVCVKGFNVFQGYYKMPEQTEEAFDEDGWLHTGDIGRWSEHGTLKIVDRKKHIFKLAQGEYVAPEKIENIYMLSKYVAQCFVYGDSLKSALVGVVVPDRDVLLNASAIKLGSEGSHLLGELCNEFMVKKLIMDDMHALGKAAGLTSFEQMKDVFLSPELFAVENDLLTPTLKSKRPKLKEHFKKQIDEMYKHMH